MPTTAYYAIALSMSQAVSLAVAFLAWRRRSISGSIYFALMMLAVAVWSAAAAIEAVSADQSTKIIWSQISYLGICAAPPLFLLFALYYWRPEIHVRRLYLVCIWIIPLATILIATTNDLHHLLWSSFAFESHDSNILIYGHGTWFWINVAYSYLLMLAGIILLSRVVIGFPRLYRRQALAVLAAAILPLIGNALYVSGGSPLKGLDIAPITFSVTGLILALGIIKFQLFDIVPSAREKMLQLMDIGMLVLDGKARVVDFNSAAERIVRKKIEVGQYVDRILEGWQGMLSMPIQTDEKRDILLANRDPQLWVDVVVSHLMDRSGRTTGHLITLQDITERKQTEDALRQSEMRFRQMVDLLPEAVCEIDTSGNLIFGNRAAFVMTGYDKKDFEKGLNILPMIVQEDRDRALGNIASMLDGEVLGADEYTLLRKDGSSFPALVHLANIIDASGNTVGFRGIVIDITERRVAEETRQRLAAIVESSHDAIIGKTLDGIITNWNKGAEERYGYSDAEVVGHPISILIPPERADEMPQFLAKVGCGEAVVDYETVRVKKDGHAVTVLLTLSPIRDVSGNVVGASSIEQDINERKRTEKLIGVRLSLLEYAATHSLEELLQKTLDEVGDLTESPIGFYHFVEKDQKTLSLQAWSTRTIKEFCKAEGKGMHYGIDQAGVWVDCVRQRRPVIHNDYNSLPHKKGLPEGHAPVIRELVVPIMRGGEVVAVLGIGNKPTDYNDMDIETVSYMADVAWEITRRKQAEIAVAEERRRLSDILRGTNVGTWEWNVQTGEAVFNKRWAEIIGYTMEELSPVNIETWVKFSHPDDLKRSGELLEKHFKGELGYYEYEARMRHKDGRWVWVLDRGRVHSWTDDGKPLWMSGTHQDITERKHIEEVLSASEEKLRLTFESIADGIVIIDLAGNVVDVNEATVRISGYRNKSQIIGRDAFDLLAPRDRRLALEDLKERVEGRPKERVEYSICPKDGRAFEAELTASTLRDENGAPIGYIAVLRDITERKLAEEALRQSEQRFRELADLLPQTIVEINTEGRFTYVNRYGFEFTGYTEEDIEKGIKAIDMFVPEQRDMATEHIGRILAGDIIDVGEYSILRKDGSISTALIYTNAVMRDGKPDGVRAIVVDISERKKIEQMKTDFVSFISHQLRTPVAGLMGYIDNMLDGITGGLNSKQTEYLGEMRDVCARNNRLIADLLNISRLERGVLSVNIQAVKLRNVVDIAAREYFKDIEGKGLALNIKETDQGISALADSDKLAEVLKNVIHNALKFTQKGSINIDISMEGDNGIIKISDTGDGMPEEVLKDLFKREKVLSGAVAVGGGAGLGLYIAKGFMQLQGGDIEVESVIGRGSTFTIILPRE